jgi:hypothetical protein
MAYLDHVVPIVKVLVRVPALAHLFYVELENLVGQARAIKDAHIPLPVGVFITLSITQKTKIVKRATCKRRVG